MLKKDKRRRSKCKLSFYYVNTDCKHRSYQLNIQDKCVIFVF